jgi:pimeloyl-ACP methyl ester carboxylesterase
MTDLYVLVHGAWHTGAEMDAVAGHLRNGGNVVHCPTIAGNNKDDDRAKIGLEQAISSIVSYIEANDLRDIRLVGHSYGGMVISGVADRLTDRIKRLVYVNAFVPLDGQCLNDMVPPQYIGLFDAAAAANNNAVMLPFEIWRDAFINDADFELTKSAFAKLMP